MLKEFAVSFDTSLIDDLAVDQALDQSRSAGYLTMFQSDDASAHPCPSLASDKHVPA